MLEKEIIKNKEFPSFLNSLAKDLTRYYYSKLDKNLKLIISLKVRDMTLLLPQTQLLKNLLDQKLVKNFQITKLQVKNMDIKNQTVIFIG